MLNHDHESATRLSTMLSTAIGEHVAKHLADVEVIEIMVNPDGKLWIDRLGQGRKFTGEVISPESVERAIFIIASSIGSVCSSLQPLISAELPSFGARFQGILPPVSPNPCFSLRKKASRVFTIDHYLHHAMIPPNFAKNLREGIIHKKNIVIAGGTGSGKTTLANALLSLIATTNDRLIIIEDTLELQCEADDCVSLRARDETASLRDLVRATMRLRPDRIIIGEVRGPEALDLLKAWNTGHPGGIATIHANSAIMALSRFEQLILEAGVSEAKQLIADTVNLIVFIEKTAQSREVTQLIEISWNATGGYSVVDIPKE